MPALEVERLSKRYGDLVAVDEISFGVGQGELFGILGPNGAGKTTTLEMIEGLRTPDAGLITILGQNALREIVNRGNGLSDIWLDWAILAAWAAGGLLVSLRVFRWQ